MKNRKKVIIPYFITMQGCSNRCIYCNQSLLKDQDGQTSLEDMINQYCWHLSDTEHNDTELAFYGGTFLNLPENRRKVLLEQAIRFKKEKKIVSLRVSTTPDSVNKKKCEEIKDIINTVEIGVQSLDNNILRLLGRNYDEKTVRTATVLLKAFGFKVCHQIMVGLPFETFNSFAKTVKGVCDLKPDFVRIYPLIVFKNTLLSNYLGLQLFSMPSQDIITRRIAFAIQNFEKLDIKVIRVGLDAFCKGVDLFFSYAESDWRGAAYTFLFGELIKQKIKGQRLKSLTVFCGKKNHQYLSRFYKLNRNFFKKSRIENVTFKSSDKGVKLEDTAIFIDELSIKTSIFDVDWSQVDLD